MLYSLVSILLGGWAVPVDWYVPLLLNRNQAVVQSAADDGVGDAQLLRPGLPQQVVQPLESDSRIGIDHHEQKIPCLVVHLVRPFAATCARRHLCTPLPLGEN